MRRVRVSHVLAASAWAAGVVNEMSPFSKPVRVPVTVVPSNRVMSPWYAVFFAPSAVPW